MTPSIRELEVLGERLAAARAADDAREGRRGAGGGRPRRSLLRRAALALPLVLAVAVPALAGRPLWAPLVDGETPLPPQTPATVRTELARGPHAAGTWRLVAYRAELRGGGVGTCLFLTDARGGAGSCGPADGRLRSATHTDGVRSFAFARAPADARRVVVRWSDGRRDRVRVRSARLRGGGTVRFAIAVRKGGPRRLPPTAVSVRAVR